MAIYRYRGMGDDVVYDSDGGYTDPASGIYYDPDGGYIDPISGMYVDGQGNIWDSAGGYEDPSGVYHAGGNQTPPSSQLWTQVEQGLTKAGPALATTAVNLWQKKTGQIPVPPKSGSISDITNALAQSGNNALRSGFGLGPANSLAAILGMPTWALAAIAVGGLWLFFGHKKAA